MAGLTLDNFERKSSIILLERGREIWSDGRVMNLESSPDGVWEAEVGGSKRNIYQVDVYLDGNAIEESSCDCPYDQSRYCKHQLAVFFAIKEQIATQAAAAPASKKMSKAAVIAKARAVNQAKTVTKALDTPANDAAPVQKLLSRAEILAKARAARQTKNNAAPEPTHGLVNATESTQLNSPEYLEAFGQLELTAARIVKIAALGWESFSLTKFLSVFNACKFRHNGQYLNSLALKPILDQLVTRGFIRITTGTGYRCDLPFAQALCDRDFKSDPDFAIIEKALHQEMALSWYGFDSNIDRRFRNLRLLRYFGQPVQFIAQYASLLHLNHPQYSQEKLLEHWLPAEFDLAKIESLPLGIQGFLLQEKFSIQLFQLHAADGYFTYALERISSFESPAKENLARQLGQIALFSGSWKVLETVLGFAGTSDQLMLNGIFKLMTGHTAESLEAFNLAQKQLRRDTRSNKKILTNLGGVFETLALLKTHGLSNLPKINKQIDQIYSQGTSFLFIFRYLQGLLLFLQNDKETGLPLLKGKLNYGFPLGVFFKFLCQFWADERLIDEQELEEYHQFLSSHDYQWLASEILALRAALHPSDEPLQHELEAVTSRLGTQPLTGLVPRVEPWELALQQLTQIAGVAGNSPGNPASDSRLVWLVDFKSGVIQPKEQKFGKKGWTGGRAVPEYNLSIKNLPCMTEQDIRIADELKHTGFYSYRSSPEVWQALVGHPFIFLYNSPETAVQLTEEFPVLITQKVSQGYQLKFSVPIENPGPQLIKETPTRYKLIVITNDHVKISKAIGGDKLLIPEKGAERLEGILSSLAPKIPVQSAFENTDLPFVAADARVCVHLLPVGNGFHVELYVKPFMTVAPYFKPGAGDESATTFLNGEQVRTRRDLKEEKKHVKALLAEVAILNDLKPQGAVWQLENVQHCLELLVQLFPLSESEKITVEWPKGEKYRINSLVGFDQFKMRIQGKNNWFEVDGEIQVDENRVLSLQELLELSAKSERFIEISPGKIIALTEEFRRRLRQIDGMMTRRKNGGLQLHPLAAGAMEVFTGMVQHQVFDQKFMEQKDKIRKAFELSYKLPKNFNAKLRSYQKEGFEWLSRCAEAEIGACLADDMGLGKTVQALALLSTRATLGPALVVAPASVCRNWVAETQKFAPALRPVLYAEGDRISALKAAGKGDLFIVTYDLLARSSEQFAATQFATILLDEAQSIKNRSTKRSETVMQLNGGFRMIMTGTPLENHLGELWNLFQFINPGLLGSIEDFNERFAIPIEKYHDADRREQLKRLVQPFMLRRRKDEVLRELPAKTEITLRVALSPEERVFYEALRRNALANLANSSDKNAGEKHLQILAEIMRLRRSACHPNLADADAGFKSSAKLNLFAEIVDELLENGHKALVFSQFVGHLKILEKYLKTKNIRYQYLDGQTPSATRQKNIDAFQAGDGDLFLISLKAGGAGLNLTAADFVIHMDPWWNPAVEDQATDRAHRIGQVKPVTVYRIVAEQTIEEKIIQLHAQKRDLADSLLEGTDVGAKLTADDLIRLIEG